MSVSTKLQKALEARHYSQAQLARDLGIGKVQVGRYFHDQITPKTEQLYKISAALDVSPFLFGLLPDKITMDGDLAGFVMEGIKEGFWTLTEEHGSPALVPSEELLWDGTLMVTDTEVLRRVADWNQDRTEEKEVLALLNNRKLDIRETDS